ncbi:MAG: phage holin family protein, partial [Clostridia bacterium]|nr:phage holin family protein [Clostridia bacterium]
MRKMLLRILINMLAFYTVGWVFPQVEPGSWQVLLLAAVVLALINLLIRPIVLLLALPLNLVTLGLFTLIVNTWMVMLTSLFVSGFGITGFWHSLTAAVISIIYSIILKPFFKKK